MNKNWLSLLGVVITVGLYACIEQTPIDIENDTSIGKLDSLFISRPVVEATAGKPVNTGSSPLLLLGQADNKRASFLIKFRNFPDSVVAQSAQLRLINTITTGDSIGTIRATVHRVMAAWEETEITFAGFQNQFDPVPVGETVLAPADSDTVYISIDPDLVTAWIDSSIQNYGLYVTAEGGRFFKQFNSGNSVSGPPVLTITYAPPDNPDTTLTADAVVEADAFLFEVLNPPAQGPLYVSDGDDYRSLLKFDLAAIPQNATINQAILTLYVDSLNSFLNSKEGHMIDVYRLTQESLDPSTAEFDTANTINAAAAVVVDTTTVLNINITRQVQNWSFGLNENFGLMLVSRRPERELYRTAFYSARMDSSRAPRVRIVFTIPPVRE